MIKISENFHKCLDFISYTSNFFLEASCNTSSFSTLRLKKFISTRCCKENQEIQASEEWHYFWNTAVKSERNMNSPIHRWDSHWGPHLIVLIGFHNTFVGYAELSGNHYYFKSITRSIFVEVYHFDAFCDLLETLIIW